MGFFTIIFLAVLCIGLYGINKKLKELDWRLGDLERGDSKSEKHDAAS